MDYVLLYDRAVLNKAFGLIRNIHLSLAQDLISTHISTFSPIGEKIDPFRPSRHISFVFL